jgi:hypothetical protein
MRPELPGQPRGEVHMAPDPSAARPVTRISQRGRAREFVRPLADRWHGEVPGARWLRGDLHIHTLDDSPGGRIRWGDRATSPIDSDSLDRYARTLLRTAKARGVEVLGLTPHAVYCDGDESLSAVWRVVEVWASQNDDDGTPFSDSIYAVFPGFEPSMADGNRGVHLQSSSTPRLGERVSFECSTQ